MSNPSGKALISADLQKKEPVTLDFTISLASGVPTLVSSMAGYPIIMGTSAAAPLDQTSIDAFLGNSSDVVAATSFSSTALGVDAIGYVINMQGQAASAILAEAMLYDTTRIFVAKQGAGAVTTALTSALADGFAVTPAGNLYGRFVATGLDASSNLLVVKLQIYLKYAV
jgi:hypothetical protein